MIGKSTITPRRNTYNYARLSSVLAVVCLFVLALPTAFAKDLYVDAGRGSDDIGYAQNDANNPWATIGRAVWGNSDRRNTNSSEAAQAGDTVNVLAGTYTTSQSTGERYLPIYNPANSGSPGNPIVIKADGLVVLQSETAGEGEPIIGTDDRNYITWDGFYIDEANVNTKSDTGPIVVWGSHHVTIQNLVVRGVEASWSDNHNSIRCENSRDVLIRNNDLSGNRGANNNYNGSTIMLYGCSDIVIENNEIHHSQAGIFVKGPGRTENFNVTIRYNVLHNLIVGITHGVTSRETGEFGTRTYQNIIHSSDYGIAFIGYTDSTPSNVHVGNNIINNSGSAFYLKPAIRGYDDVVFRNNVVTNSEIAINAADLEQIRGMEFSRNLYSSNATAARVYYTNYRLTEWQSNFGQDVVGTITDDPLFVNPAQNDYRLSSASPARNAGVDFLNLLGRGTGETVDLGVYVSGEEIIGTSDELTNLRARPAPPTLE